MTANFFKKINEISAMQEYKQIFRITKDYRKITETWQFNS